MKASLLLIGHGTRSATGADQFAMLVQQLRQQLPDRAVEGCFLELRAPSIEQAWQKLIEAGADCIHAVPLLLFSAGHAKQDIPAALAACRARCPAVAVDVARPLSRHRSLLKRSCQCVQQAMQQDAAEDGDGTAPAIAEGGTALVMVGRGSFDVCAQADMRLFAECVFRDLNDSLDRPLVSVDTAFYAMAQPDVATVLEQVCRRPGVSHILVQPHLLFAGQLLDAIERQVDAARQTHPQLRFSLGPPLGPHALVAEAVCGRMLELEPQPAHPT